MQKIEGNNSRKLSKTYTAFFQHLWILFKLHMRNIIQVLFKILGSQNRPHKSSAKIIQVSVYSLLDF